MGQVRRKTYKAACERKVSLLEGWQRGPDAKLVCRFRYIYLCAIISPSGFKSGFFEGYFVFTKSLLSPGSVYVEKSFKALCQIYSSYEVFINIYIALLSKSQSIRML